MSISLRVGGVVLTSGLWLGGALGAASGQTPWVAPEAEKARKNPLASDTKAIEQGEKIAKTNCASCHGAKGKGDGAAAVALKPRPADWTSQKAQSESDGEIIWKISNGRGAMPLWKHLVENDQ